jgi:hypothetical protein
LLATAVIGLNVPGSKSELGEAMEVFCLVALSFCRIQTHELARSSHGFIPLNSSDEVMFDIVKVPLIVHLPRIDGFSASVYEQKNSALIQFATLDASRPARAVLFRSRGRLLVLASSATVFEYFSIQPGRPCPIFTLTTARRDVFRAHRDPAVVDATKANLTIKHNQKHCVFHLSNAAEPTRVSVNYSTEDHYDILWFDDTQKETALMGDGTFSAQVDKLALFAWISDPTTLSDSFSIAFDAPTSSLPHLVLKWSAELWPEQTTQPEVLWAAGAATAPPPTGKYANQDADWQERVEEHGKSNIVVVAIFAGAAAIVILIGGVAIALLRPRARDDGSHVQMLAHEDKDRAIFGQRETVASEDNCGETDTRHVRDVEDAQIPDNIY